METNTKRETSNFGRQLRYWRDKKKLSQLELAGLAVTTPRHISFVETGRSRPGKELVLRIVKAMNLRARDANRLLTSAGFPIEYAEHEFGSDPITPYRAAIEALLAKHDPYPGCAMDPVGNILLANAAFKRFSPNALVGTPEERVDGFFDPNGPARDIVINWEEVAWNLFDRLKAELAMTNNMRLADLVERAGNLLRPLERPQSLGNTDPIIVSPRFEIGEQIISTFATVMRFESANEVTLSEIRVELSFPADDVSRRFFENLA